MVCNLNGQPYEKLAERCSTIHTIRSRSYSTGSSDTSCSTTPEALSDEDNSSLFQKKTVDLTNNKKLTANQVNIITVQELNDVKNSAESNGEHQIGGE